jgi:SNF2 family DNA or RNA helicase
VAKVRDFVKEVKERLESGQPVLIGAWHQDVIDALVEALHSKYRVAAIDGRVSPKNTELAVADWNAGELDVIVGQIAKMGVSLNLQQGGHQIMVIEEDWSPAVMSQFFARLWRYGQEHHVHVDILETKTKIDAALGRINKTKDREQGKFNAVGRELTHGT